MLWAERSHPRGAIYWGVGLPLCPLLGRWCLKLLPPGKFILHPRSPADTSGQPRCLHCKVVVHPTAWDGGAGPSCLLLHFPSLGHDSFTKPLGFLQHWL